MDELIQQLTAKLGIDPSVASDATSKAMGMLKGQVGDDLFSKVSSAIPGASEAAEQGLAKTDDAGGGGMLGQLASMASGALGGGAGQGIELAGMLKSAGLEADQLPGFVGTVIDFLKDKLGDDTLNEVLEKFPILKSLLD
ncbi:MAG: DUF2780 domain-containing protein [Rubripirellula sp.]